MYHIFNVAVASNLALPELPEISDPTGMRVYRFELASADDFPVPSTGIEWFHDWVDPQGNIAISAGRSESGQWLQFPHLAVFLVELTARRITAFPALDTDHKTLRHLFLDQVIPRVLGQEGTLVLHAGAVTLDNGKTLAFVGETGHGKSTLVSSFEQNGARLITDDCLMVEPDQGFARVIPNYAGVRLYDDSIDAIYGSQPSVTDVAQYTSKRRLMAAVDAMEEQNDPVRLDAMFLLGDLVGSDDSSVQIAPAAGTDALMTLVAQSFLLDITDKDLVAKLFGAAGELLRSTSHCYVLNYPRRFEELQAVRDAVMEHLPE